MQPSADEASSSDAKKAKPSPTSAASMSSARGDEADLIAKRKEWAVFARALAQFDRQYRQLHNESKRSFAFAFLEGTLVKVRIDAM